MAAPSADARKPQILPAKPAPSEGRAVAVVIPSFDFPDPRMVAELDFMIGGLEFPEPGEYRVTVSLPPPSLIRVPPGCPFHPRCPHRFSPCDKEVPAFKDRGGGHPEACHLAVEDKRRLWAERESRRLKVAV